MGRQERPLPPGPLHDFAAGLRALRASAGMSYRELSRRAGSNRVADFNDPTSWQCWQTNGELGRLDFTAYCRQAGHPGATATGTTAYAWTCAGASGGIDTQAACRLLYRVPAAISRFQNYYDRDTWQCWG